MKFDLFQRSVVFRKRAKTPPSYLRQHDFARQLEAQIKSKQEEQRSEKRDKDFIERLEQIQLAESFVFYSLSRNVLRSIHLDYHTNEKRI